jgi:hypothetical protein
MVEQNAFALFLVFLSATSAGLSAIIGPLRAGIVALALAVLTALVVWTRLGRYLGIRSFAAQEPSTGYFRRRASAAVLVTVLIAGLAVINPLHGGAASDLKDQAASSASVPRVVGIHVGGGGTLVMNGGSVVSSGTGIEVTEGSTARLSRTPVVSGVVDSFGGYGLAKFWFVANLVVALAHASLAYPVTPRPL